MTQDPGGAGGRRRVVVVTLDQITERMAGPAIRAWEIASLLGCEHDVRLVTFGRAERSTEAFAVEHVDVADFRRVVEWSDVVVVQGFVVATFPWLHSLDRVLVVDLYDPFHLESLEVERFKPLARRDAALANALRELDAQTGRGDFFLCASHRQRDLWIGHLAGRGRINPLTYEDDPSLDSLIRIAPFGLPEEPPVQHRHAIKGQVEGIGPDDKVILWGGGVYNWFDPITLVRAVDVLRARVPEVRLFFLGMKHPNPDVPEMQVATQTRALADELGLTGTHVFFNETWVTYEERSSYLLDADLGVSCHFPQVETEFSFRTRILDYLWAGLPIVCTAGDSFADLVEREDLGRVVPPQDVDALVEALEHVLVSSADRDRYRANVAVVAERFRWSRALAPLVEFCRAPRRAADWASHGARVAPRHRVQQLWWDVVTATRHLRAGGPKLLVERVKMRLGRG
ncbi:glycosyltransferase family 4 protein [Cellulomonas sp. Root137]|uniref:glycosyltransferase family 4 protein n=1 Tax=Cellulomonas sp. Root137 TaxID=1736459 RepID=UPI0006FC60C8|nr:glycosyltransferase family 4 protein [Cellulomonas sp. Root137]KQY47485.1 glycosyl transferase family 1 [Cellulomonas sp. Root137]